MKSALAQLLLNVVDDRLRLFPYQARFIDDESRFRIVLKSRQVGGSFMIAVEALLYALLRPNTTILLVSRSLRQSVELMRKVKTFIKQFEGVRLRYEDTVYSLNISRDTETMIEFGNGSRIISLPNSPDTIRGYSADLVYVDEAAMFKNDEELRKAVAFTTTATRGRITLISTPKGRRGWFYEAYREAQHGGKWSLHRIHYSERPDLRPEELEELRATMTELDWRQEMELEFLDEAAALFPYDLILAATEDYSTQLETLENGYVGIDFGRYRDSTVIIAVEKSEKLRVRFIHAMVGEDFNKQIDFITKACGIIKPIRVLVDKTGMGIPLYDVLAKKLGAIVDGFTFTTSNKEALILRLYNAFRNNEVIIPADATELVNQLHQFQRKEERGHVKFEAPAGGHDDYVMALALAVYAATVQTTSRINVGTVWKW